MKNTPDLQNLGKNISKDYLESDISLNDSLAKVASLHGLNKNELHRVAEAANVETYLGLSKVADDKYINFDLADASKVYQEIEKTASLNKEVDDEEDYVDIDNNPEFSLTLYPDTDLEEEKIANDELKAFNRKSWLEAALNILENEASEKLAELAETNTNIYDNIKQQLLQDVSFSDIGNFMKLSGFVEDGYISNLIEDLKSEFPVEKFEIEELEKTAEDLNTDSELYRDLENLTKIATYLEKLNHAYNKNYDDLKLLTSEHKLPFVKESGVFKGLGLLTKEIGKSVKGATSGTFKFLKEHPKTTTGLVGAGIATPIATASATAREKAKKNVLTREEANKRLRNLKI